ncbi:PRA1 family protein [Popillia japonica]|uniref:PRA1 family protein n=1 Tax=Popillia japonica TaxID=7064 RepID=A0AAW1NIF0_POPJA
MFKLTKSDDLQFAPLRTLDDFLLESARFQLPNFKDLDKWGNRVSNNLLYYQTNYFLMSLIIFAIIGVIHPIKMIYGICVSSVLILIFWYITNESVTASQFKRKHPIVSIILVFAGIYLVMNMLDSMLVFFLGILLPFSASFIHSSLRLRNIKNKIANQAENYNLKQTPMGFFLKELGLKPELF